MNLRVALLTSLVLASGACVTSGTHKKKIAELNKLREDQAAAAAKREKELLDQLADITKKLGDTTTERDKLQKAVDEGTALTATLQQRLEKLGQNVDSLTKDKNEAAARLEELRKQKAAADARLSTFKNLLSKLRSMIDSGQLKVIIRDGRMIIALPNDILFDSGKVEVKKEGKAALEKVAQVLATVPDRDFLVAGHTDDVPIKTSQFPSNWELSTGRAVEVVRFLISKGMSGKVLAAAGFAEFDPVVANDSSEHRAQNRRIEIVLQPNISDLPPLDDIAQ
ncbi:MAG: OmpA family protein [Kofleriaceae bacterium]|nr:OmpA family protein [Kofleriaceae bacterium]